MTGLEDVAALGQQVALRLLETLPDADRIGALADMEALTGAFRREMTACPYYALTPAIREEWRRRVLARGDQAHRFARLLLAHLIARCATSQARAIPASILPQIREQFSRILRRVTGRGMRDLTLDDDVYLKDLALCRLEALPCAVQIVERGAGIPRRALVAGGVGQTARLLMLAARSGVAWKPYLEMHLHTPMLKAFSPEGWRKCYLLIADMMRGEPDCLGLLGGSWFYDPAVEQFSPHLAYLRREPLAGGALFFRRETRPEDIRNATATPEPRRQAYLDGRYKPSAWMLVWPREALLAWADRIVAADDIRPDQSDV